MPGKLVNPDASEASLQLVHSLRGAWVEERRQANRKVVFIRGKHIKYRTARGAGFPMLYSIHDGK